MLVKPEHWYMLFWTLGGVLALSPLYLLLYRIWRVAETIQFILSIRK